tara:strand:- start:605 stop:997 length:393 start_codon:yes stop_codon:yes gene_type:complete
MQKLIDGLWEDCTQDDLVDGDVYRISVGNGGWQQQTYSTPEPLPEIRKISTGAMQRRFTIDEEVFIASDAAATVIKSRLLNASYCDLDFQDTIDGVTYICGILAAGAVIIDAAVRVDELLIDGAEGERYP